MKASAFINFGLLYYDSTTVNMIIIDISVISSSAKCLDDYDDCHVLL